MAGFSRRTVKLDVEVYGGRRGSIIVVEGEVWSASYEGMSGVEGIAALVGSAVVHIAVSELDEDPGPRQIEVSINGLLLEFARLEDEARREARELLEGHGDREEGAPEITPDEFFDLLRESGVHVAAPAEQDEDDDHQQLRRLLTALLGAQPLEVEAELAQLGSSRAHARAWLRALSRAPERAQADPRVYLLGFPPSRAQALVEMLEARGVEALAIEDAAALEGLGIPALLVTLLELPDLLDDIEAQTLARFDPIWALRVGERCCPWVAVTDRPTRFGRSLCGSLGAMDWFAQEPTDPDDALLAGQLAGCLRHSEGRALPRALGVIDVALMLVDLEVDALIDLRGERGSGSLEVVGGQLFAASSCLDEHALVGVEAAAELCRWTGVSVEVHAPSHTIDRNLPRGLPLALAALASTLPSPNNHRAPEKNQVAMSKLNQVCESIIDDVQDALACGVVDLDTGMLMGIHHNVAYFTQSYLDAVAAAAVDMFRGKNVRRVERLISKHRGQEITDAFEEIFISSPAVFHFMKLIPDKSAVVVLVTRKATNQGMGWASLRVAMADIAAALP